MYLVVEIEPQLFFDQWNYRRTDFFRDIRLPSKYDYRPYTQLLLLEKMWTHGLTGRAIEAMIVETKSTAGNKKLVNIAIFHRCSHKDCDRKICSAREITDRISGLKMAS